MHRHRQLAIFILANSVCGVLKAQNKVRYGTANGHGPVDINSTTTPIIALVPLHFIDHGRSGMGEPYRWFGKDLIIILGNNGCLVLSCMFPFPPSVLSRTFDEPFIHSQWNGTVRSRAQIWQKQTLSIVIKFDRPTTSTSTSRDRRIRRHSCRSEQVSLTVPCLSRKQALLLLYSLQSQSIYRTLPTGPH